MTGLNTHPDTWVESKVRRDRLELQTRHLAAALTAGGYNCFREMGGNEICVVGMVTGGVEKIAPYRNLNILPTVASANRCQLLKQMDFFATTTPHHLRMARVTGGARCSLADLRGRLQDLGRTVSNYSSTPELKAWGIEVVIRCAEITVKRDENDQPSCHPHAHCVFAFSRRLETEEFRAWLKFSHDFFGASWTDNGRLVSSAEILKYPTKPTDLECLTEKELVDFARALEGVKLTSPMGTFQDLRREMEDKNVKLSKTKSTEQGEWEWCYIERRSRLAADVTEDDADLAETIEEIQNELQKKQPCNHALALLAPSPRFISRFEPSILVLNYTGNLEALLAAAQLESTASYAREAWHARSAEPPALTSPPSRQLLYDGREKLIRDREAVAPP